MIVKIKKLELVNFKGYIHKIFDFSNIDSNRIKIKGDNKMCKTTIEDAYYFAIEGKNRDGLSATNKYGFEALNNKTSDNFCSVEVTLEYDNQLLKLKRELVSKKSTATNEDKDKTSLKTSLYVNDMIVQSADFESYIHERLKIEKDMFRALTDVDYLANPKKFDGDELRKLLIELFEDKKAEEQIIDVHPDFKRLLNVDLDILRASEVSKITAHKKSLTALDTVINQNKKLILEFRGSNYDPKEDYNGLLEGINTGIAIYESNIQDIKNNSGLVKLQAKLNEKIIQKNKEYDIFLNSGFTLKDKEQELNKLNLAKITKGNEISSKENEIVKFTDQKNIAFAKANKLKEKHTEENKVLFNKTKCVTCNREFDLDDKQLEKEQNKFKAEKEKRLEDIKKEYDTVKATYDELKAKIQTINDIELVKLNKELASIENEIKEVMDKKVDMFKPNEKLELEIKELELEIEELKAQPNDAILTIQTKIEQDKLRKLEFESIIANEKNIKTLEVGIKHSETQIDVEKKALLECEKTIEDIDTFNQARITMVNNKVSKLFKIARFQIEKEQKNGKENKVCRVLSYDKKIDSLTDYMTNSSTSQKILTSLEIIDIVSSKKGVRLPIFINNAESINPASIPDMDNQMIFLLADYSVEELVVE